MKTKYYLLLLITLFLVLSSGNIASAQKKQCCFVKYNEFDNTGKELFITAIAWFDFLPEIPVYTYFDKDLGKKVVIKTTITTYKKEVLASLGEFNIKAGDYATIIVECPDKSQKTILNIQQQLPEFEGENLAFEAKSSDLAITFYCYPFENDFPFKFEEDLVKKTFTTTELSQYCK